MCDVSMSGGVSACPAGRFGPDCARVAACGGAQNDPVSGRCLCGPGRRGEDCGHGETPQMPSMPSGPKHAFGSFHGFACSNEIEALIPVRGLVPGCPPGWFGLGCLHRCDCSNGGRCDAATGNCSCGLGWTGARCDQGATKTQLVDLFMVYCRVKDLLCFVVVTSFCCVRMSCRHVWCQLPAHMRLWGQQHL